MLPLKNVKIVDLTRLLPGAICTMLLADMGADVIKVEDPTLGDYARWMPPLLEGQGAFFRASNRNKRSVIIDLKRPAGKLVLHQLIASADVVIEGFRPGVAERLGIDYNTLKRVNRRIIYCSLSGWGQTGTYAEVSGHDLNYVALSGLLGSMETPQVLGGQIADISGAYAGAMGILGRLYARERTGDGGKIDIALYEAGMLFSMYQWVESIVTDSKGGLGSLTGGMAFYRVYASKDNHPMAFAPIEPKFWANFCNAVNRPDLIEHHDKPENQPHLLAELTALFASETAHHWQKVLGNADCCFSLITPPQALLDDPHVQDRQMLGIAPDGVPFMRSPVHLTEGGEKRPEYAPSPRHGEHTEEVLLEIGFTNEQITQMKQLEVIK